MNVDAVISEIELAFPQRPMPEMTVRQAQLADQSMAREITQEEWDAEGARDAGVSWNQLSDETLIECEAALAHLSEVGFVYYIPAYMRLGLRDLVSQRGRQPTFHSAVFALTDDSNYSLGRYKRLGTYKSMRSSHF